MARCLGDVMRERARREGRIGARPMPGHVTDGTTLVEKWTDRQEARRKDREPGLAARREAVEDTLRAALEGKPLPRPPAAPTARRVILDRPKQPEPRPRASVPVEQAKAVRQATWAAKLGYATVADMIEHRRIRKRASQPVRNRRYRESAKKGEPPVRRGTT